MHKVLNFLTVLFAFSFIALKLNASGIITTVAGDLLPGGANIATASLVFPKAVTVDNQGNVYIADAYSQKIKKLDPNGNLTDLGVPNLNEPQGVVADALGNIYISDTNNGRIKKRDSQGNITTVAGDGGTANVQYLEPISAAGVSLLRPMGLGLDQSGNLYITDKGNSAIRKLQIDSSFISTTAGRAGTLAGRSAEFSGDGGQAIDADLQYPFGVAVDSVRNVIYIADTYNNRVRKVDALGVITTVAGSPNGEGADSNDLIGDPNSDGYRGDGGPATSAMLSGPTGLAVDSAGNLYIADTGNAIIRKVATNGTITTVAGTIPVVSLNTPIPQTGYSGDGGPATSAKLSSPYAVACDAAGNLYIADTANSRIRKVTFESAPTITTPTSANIGSTSATLGGNVTGTGGVSLTAVGVVYAATSANSNPQLSGTGVTNLAGTAATGVFTVNATGLTAGTAYSYAAYATNSQGTTYTSVGTFTTGPTPTLTFATPSIASVAGGATLANAVTSTLSGGSYGAISYTSSSPSVATVNATTGVVTGLAVGTTTITATQAAAPGFNAATSTSYTLTVTIDYTFTTLAGTAGSEGSANDAGSAARFRYPGGVAVDATGNVYVADENNHTIRKITSGGVVTTLAGTAGSSGSTDGTGSAARFTFPTGVAVDAAGNVYVADRANHSIRKITSGGVVTTLAGSTAGDSGSADGTGSAARFSSPRGVAVDVEGNVYVAEAGNHTIRKITSGGVVTTLAGSAGSSGSTDGTGSAARFSSPRGVAVDTAGNVYVADWLNQTIRKITSGGVVTTLAGSAGSSGSTDGTGSAARFSSPRGVAVDVEGNVYVADQNNHTIRKITSGGVVTTLAGSAGSSGSTDGIGSAARFYEPVGVAVDATGNLYVADNSNHTIRKGSLLPLLTTPTSANLTATTATLGGNVTTDAGSSITARGVVYAVTATNATPQLGGTGVTNVAGTGTTGAFTVNVTGLTAGTAYSYAAYANNSLGTGYTSVGSFTTAAPTPTLTFTTPSTASVAVGATRTNAVTSTLSGGSYGAITYTSSDTGKATVNATTGVVTGVAVGTTTITAIQAAASGYNATASNSYTLTVTIGTPTITAAPTATGIAFGQTLASSTLSGGTASVPGTFAFTTPSTAPNAGTAAQGVTFTPTSTANYNAVTTTVNVTVAKATPTVTWATPSAITYGTALSATQLNATGSVAGTIVYSPASGTTPSAGTQTLTATFTPTDTANYNTATRTVSLVVGKATPTLTWATPSAITYGTALSATQLNATSSVAGTIVYSPASGTTPSAGTQTLTATFTPTDTTNYNPATGTVSLTVNKATPTLTWATPSAITYGTALSATQLNATGSVAGTIVYSPASGTTPSAGTQTLTATFTPTDTTNYNSATGTVSLTVNKATPTITWATPSTITYGTALSATQLNATASAAGTITYSPASGTTPSAGTQTLTATFTPTDTTNYNSATATVSLTVNKATPTLTWATPSTITYGTALSATQLNVTASAAGTITYSPASGSVPSVGTQTLSASFTPTDSTNYNSASASVSLNVIVAVPGAPTSISATTANGEATVTFTAPSNPGSSAITGYTIRAMASDGSTVTVTATGSPAKVTGLTPGKSYRFTVTANNSAGSSDTSTTSDGLTISLVNQTITFATPTDRTSNSGSFNLAATASSGLPVTFTVVSGPALLTAGNVLDLTGAAGTVKIRASQAGNTTYAAAPVVDVSFNVTAGNAQVVLSSVVNPTTQKSEGTLGVVLAGGSRSGVLLMVASGNGPSGTAEFTLGAGGAFTASFESSATPSGLPLEPGVQAASITYTFTGTFINNVLTGSIQPLGYGFKAEAPVNPTASTTSVGLYTSAALSAESGTVYSLVGANNEVLVLVKTPTVTTGGLTTLKSDGSYTLATTTTSGSVTLNGGVNPTTTTTTATLTLPGNTKVDFSGLSTSTKRTDRLINLSSRAKVGTGESVLITGFVIGGTDTKKVLIRAAGPALASFGLASTLPNPTIKIYQGANLIAQNDDWSKDDAAEIARLGAFAFTVGSKDAALLATLAPGAYTSHISDPSGTGTGVALAEIYDASVNPNAESQRLVNISSRGRVTPDDGVLIGGFVVTGNAPKTLLIRGIGPALTSFGISGALADPALTIYQDSKVIATNEGWANSAAIAAAAIQTGAFMLPAASKDAAVLMTLNPGAYTAQIKSAKNASSGVALIEIYEVP